MKALVSIMALAIALAWPAAGGAQDRKAKARSATAAQQQYVHRRHARVRVTPSRPEKPCAARTWVGCLGWTPIRTCA